MQPSPLLTPHTGQSADSTAQLKTTDNLLYHSLMRPTPDTTNLPASLFPYPATPLSPLEPNMRAESSADIDTDQ